MTSDDFDRLFDGAFAEWAQDAAQSPLATLFPALNSGTAPNELSRSQPSIFHGVEATGNRPGSQRKIPAGNGIFIVSAYWSKTLLSD